MSKEVILNRVLYPLYTYFQGFFKDWRKVLIVLLVVSIFFLLGTYVKEIFFITLLTLVGAFSLIYNRFFRISLGIELCMLATILCSIVYGPVVGASVGFVTLFFSLVISNTFKHSSFISLLTLPLIGIIAYFLQSLPITLLGILMTLLYDAIILPSYYVMGSRMYRILLFFFTHMLFNYWIFSNIAPFLLRTMLASKL